MGGMLWTLFGSVIAVVVAVAGSRIGDRVVESRLQRGMPAGDPNKPVWVRPGPNAKSIELRQEHA